MECVIAFHKGFFEDIQRGLLMNRIVIVDDEQFVRKGIIALVDWEKINYQVVGEASNGEDALDLILEEKPDVVLTDIRMPVFDGLQLIQKIKELAIRVPKFIIISGYNDFEYAQKAVRLGVTDFILKPVDKDEIEKTFVDLTPVIERERLEERANQRFINYSLYQRVLLEDGEPTSQELALLTEDIDKRNGYLIVDIRQDPIMDKADELLNRAVVDFLGDQSVFIHPLENGDFGIVLQEKHLPQQINELPWLLSRLKSHLEKELDQKVFLFAGEVNSGLDGLKRSFKTAVKASERRYIQLDDQPLIYNEELEKHHSENKPLDFQLVTKLMEKIEENKTKAIKEQIEEWVDEVQSMGVSTDSVKVFLFHFEKKVEATIYQLSDDDQEIELDSLVLAYEQKLTLNELQKELERYALEAGKILCKLSKEMFNGEIYRVKRYINRNYNENLTLKKIAAKFYMNPVYLGQLFKKTYGIYFKDYLLNVRIEKAKQMLRQTDMRIYEVAEKVGFGSPDYFVTQFEKTEGSTPSKYRQRIMN